MNKLSNEPLTKNKSNAEFPGVNDLLNKFSLYISFSSIISLQCALTSDNIRIAFSIEMLASIILRFLWIITILYVINYILPEASSLGNTFIISFVCLKPALNIDAILRVLL